MNKLIHSLFAAATGLAVSAACSAIAAESAAGGAAPQGIRNVVLVHGAYADGSCWTDVIQRLQRAGMHVMSVQNPLTSLNDDVEATRRVLALQDGPAILVGHSWGGAVISEAGVDPKVAGLVYIAARAPDAGEDFGALAKQFPAPPASAGLIKSGGFIRLSQQAFLRDFAGDVDPVRANALYATQALVAAPLFASKLTNAAWHTKPSWYMVSSNDRTINPDFQRFLAKRIKAVTTEVPASHLPMISYPDEVAKLILQAAEQVSTR